MKRHLVFAIVLASAGQALGADFDIDAYCRKVSEAAADRPKAEATCRDREKGFKAKLDRTSVPSDVERDALQRAVHVTALGCEVHGQVPDPEGDVVLVPGSAPSRVAPETL